MKMVKQENGQEYCNPNPGDARHQKKREAVGDVWDPTVWQTLVGRMYGSWAYVAPCNGTIDAGMTPCRTACVWEA